MATHGQHDGMMAGQTMPFGYDLSNIQSTTAPRHSILNSDDQALMDSFWSAPGTMAIPGSENALDFSGFAMDAKGHHNAESTLFGDGGHYTSGLGIESDAGGDSNDGGLAYLGTASYPHMFTHNDNDISTAQQPETEDQAASTLVSMATNPQQKNAHNTQSWGNFNMPMNFYADQISNNTMASSATATPTTPTQAHPTQLSRQMQGQLYYTHNFMHPSADKSSTLQQPARRASSQVNMRQMPAGQQQQQWNALHSPVHSGQGASPVMQFGSDTSFDQQRFQRPAYGLPVDKSGNILQAYNAGSMTNGTAPSRAGMSFSQTPNGQILVNQQTGQRMSVPNNLQALGAAAFTRQYQERPATTTTHQTHTTPWPSNMMNNQQLSRKRGHSEIEDQTTSQDVAPPARRGPAVPKAESFDNPNNQGSLITPPGSIKRRRSNAARPDTSSSTTGSPSTPADSSQGPAPKRKRSEPKQSRANLSDAQKRSNHIASEQKRRNAMKGNFEELNEMVPSLQRGQHGLSRSDILQRAADYLETLTACNLSLLKNYNISSDTLSDVEDEEGQEEEPDEADDDVGYVARGNAEGVTTYG